MDLIEVKKALGRDEKLVKILSKLVADMETQYGATAEEIEKDPAKYGYHTAMTDVAQVRCPILIINGRNDDNSPPSIIEVYVKKLREAGKHVDTYEPDDGRHGFYYGRWGDAPNGTKPRAGPWRSSNNNSKNSQPPASRSNKNRPKKTSAKPPPASRASGGRQPTLDQYGTLNWVDPDHSEPEGLHYKTFHSDTINADVSYMVYLPPDYEQNETVRYPVLYHLHASGGTPARDGAEIVERLDKAVRAGRVDPMIMICINGLRGATMYSDSKDGRYPVETVTIKDLIPHVDATYRTLAVREARALEGFSMGGFGAAHFGFKYPEVFAVISIMRRRCWGPS